MFSTPRLQRGDAQHPRRSLDHLLELLLAEHRYSNGVGVHAGVGVSGV